MQIKFEIEAGLVNHQGPTVDVVCNDKFLHMDKILLEKNIFTVDVDHEQSNKIVFVHKNKNDQDTVLVNDKIVADKFLQVNKIWVDNILVKEYIFGLAIPEYSDSYLKSQLVKPPVSYISDSLYFNGVLEYFFEKNFFDTLDNKIKHTDLKWAGLHQNEQDVYLGYNQDTIIEKKILEILEKNGFCVTR